MTPFGKRSGNDFMSALASWIPIKNVLDTISRTKKYVVFGKVVLGNFG